MNTAPSLFTRSFLLLCCALFLGYANQWVLTPLIPLYVDDLGGSAFVAGLALLAFSVPSFTVRPLVGRLADRWSAAGVMAVGLTLLAAGSALFLVPFLAMVFVGGFVRGLGWAGLNTGGYTRLATAAPPERRGEAAGYYTSVMATVAVIFPALALWLIETRIGFPGVFLLSALLALGGLPIALALTQERSGTKPSAQAAAEPAPAGWIERGVLLATGLNLCSTLVMPSVMAFMPLYARSLGIENIGLFYILVGITGIIVRPVLGKKSDAMGRGPAIAAGLLAQLVGLVLVFVAHDLALMVAGGIFVSIGSAMIGATTTALAMDLAHPAARGRGMATYSLSYQVGMGVGAMIAGALADLVGLRGMYAGSLVITVAGFALLATAWAALPRPAISDEASQMKRLR